MLNRLRVKQALDKGFTLIELLIVIVILGILGGLAVFGVATFRGDSIDAACKADGKLVSVAAEAFNAKTGAYPADMAALTGANYLKAAPSSPHYTIVLAANTGVVTGTKTVGGGACAP